MARQPHRRTTSDQAPNREGPGPAPAPAQPDTARGAPDVGARAAPAAAPALSAPAAAAARPGTTTGAARPGTTTGAPGAPGGTGPPGGLARLRARLARARCLWRDFTGESAYDRYVERHRREHPDHEPMSEREWWRARAEHDERNVSTGCC